MFTNRKERAELLEGLVVSNKDATVPILPQVRLATAPVDLPDLLLRTVHANMLSRIQ